MDEYGLSSDEMDVYVMAELPSNIVLADQFAELFDGFSIGSNDLTQLTLGVDRNSEKLAPLFDETDDSVTRSISSVIEAAHRHDRPVGISAATLLRRFPSTPSSCSRPTSTRSRSRRTSR